MDLLSLTCLEYDPNNSILSPQILSTPSRSGSIDRGTSNRGSRGRGRGSSRGQRNGRSDLSSAGPNSDKRNSTLVVENIPEDKLDDGVVRDFFGSFGSIDNIELNPSKSLAVIRFSEFDGAKAAYTSPAPIFDNRFVKVFWYKSGETNETKRKPFESYTEPGNLEAMDIDMDEFNKKQEGAQKVHDEKMAKKKAIEEAGKELEKRKEELLQKQQEQKRLLLEKLAKKHGATSMAPASTNTSSTQTNGNTKTTPPTKEEAEAQRTAALRAQLEALEAEAASLGIDHLKMDQPLSDYNHDPYSSYRGRGRGARGAYRGRGAYIPRGRGAPYTPYSAYRGGRGNSFMRGGSTMKLDNRTRKITITGVHGDKDEGLRQYLLVRLFLPIHFLMAFQQWLWIKANYVAHG